MSGVVLRCPNCGTTRGAPGECEACHEAQVRYHCTNHTPGRWLDAPACPACGARFAGPARPAAASPPPGTAPRPASAPVPTTAATRDGRRGTGDAPWGPRGRPAAPAPEAAPGGPSVEDAAARDGGSPPASPTPVWPDLRRAVSRVRRTPAGTAPAPETPATAGGLPPGGCLARALFLAMLLLVAFVGMTVLFGGSLLQVFLGSY